MPEDSLFLSPTAWSRVAPLAVSGTASLSLTGAYRMLSWPWGWRLSAWREDKDCDPADMRGGGYGSHFPTPRGHAHPHVPLGGDPLPRRLRGPGQSWESGFLIGVLGPAALAVRVDAVCVLIVAVGPTVTAEVPGAGVQAAAR